MAYGKLKIDQVQSSTKTINVDDLVVSSSGNVNLTGTSTAASFIPTSSTAPTNGIYLPATNSVAISTNGSGRLFVDSSGRVGFGIAAPTDQLHVYTNQADNVIAKFENAQGLNGNLIQFVHGSAGANNAYIGHGGDATGNLLILNAANSATAFWTNNTERMRLDSSGGFQFKGAGTAGSTQAVSFNGSAPVNSLVIDSSGRLGLGTSSPSNTAGFGQQLEVAGTLPCITLNQNDAGFTTRKYSLAVNASGDFGIWDNTSTAYRLYINSSGNVGIGTTSPSNTIDVNGTGRFRLGGTNQLVFTTDGGNPYILSEQNAPLHFGTNNLLRATIDSSGRLLVGTSTSINNALEAGLQVVGTTADAYISITRYNSAAGSPAGIILGRSKSATKGTNTAVAQDDFLGIVEFTGADGGSSFRSAASVAAYVDGAVTGGGAADMPGRLVFSTTADGAPSPTERMRIYSSGEARVVSEGTAFGAFTTQAAGTSTAIFLGRYNATAGNVASGTDSIIIWSNGNVVNTNDSYGGISDIKLKENIVDAESQWDDFKAVRFRKYNFKEETGYETFTQLGVIAQELELVSPGLVTETPDLDEDGNDLGTTTKSVKYSILTKKALVALQEAMERIEQLESEMAEVKAQLQAS